MQYQEKREHWVSVPRYFDLGKSCGLSIEEAAKRFIAAALTPAGIGQIRGIRRAISGDDSLLIPLSFAAVSVPQGLWRYLEGEPVDAQGKCDWLDNPEGTEAWAEFDCVAGSLTVYDWWPDDDLEHGRVEYLSLLIEETFARRALTGELLKQEGKTGARFSDEERRDWIKGRGRSPGGEKQAFREYRELPRYDGTKSPEFSAECQAIWGPLIGRPKKVSENA